MSYDRPDLAQSLSGIYGIPLAAYVARKALATTGSQLLCISYDLFTPLSSLFDGIIMT